MNVIAQTVEKGRKSSISLCTRASPSIVLIEDLQSYSANSDRFKDEVKLFSADSIEKLSKALRPVSDEQDANAAVALLLKPKSCGFDILFVKRVENSADPWSGQIAFPGGKRESKDANLKQTIVRETMEETNINLLFQCRFLGVMVALRSKSRPEMKVLPFIILLEREPQIKLNKKELESFVWFSLGEKFPNKSTMKSDLGEFPAFLLGRTVVWGLTYRILKNFIQILKISSCQFGKDTRKKNCGRQLDQY